MAVVLISVVTMFVAGFATGLLRTEGLVLNRNKVGTFALSICLFTALLAFEVGPRIGAVQSTMELLIGAFSIVVMSLIAGLVVGFAWGEHRKAST